ncbi:CU044_2847 family protein [Streptomyces gamaensis]|uniref:CU044_2847 family protein n=1 Tax=Streptomyces gamaensis TaxID=1763542 RepID=A0ABW0ZAI3_9ACTN
MRVAGGITQVRLDDGTVVWARVSQAQENGLLPPGRGDTDSGQSPYADSSFVPADGPYTDSSAAQRVADLADGVGDVVRGVVGSVRRGLTGAAPDEVTVEFGIELSAKAGKVVSLLADGEGKASIKVSLTWSERGTHPAAGTPAAP